MLLGGTESEAARVLVQPGPRDMSLEGYRTCAPGGARPLADRRAVPSIDTAALRPADDDRRVVMQNMELLSG
jgi:hypothetical protein